MYIDEFWKYFEQTGDIETYLYLKQCERVSDEHININDIDISLEETEINSSENEFDGMK